MNPFKESFPIVPVHDISKVIRTPAPKAYQAKLAQPVQDLLTETEETLRLEIRKCLKALTQLLPNSDGYDSLAVRLAGFLRDYLQVSGTSDLQAEEREIRKAIVSTEAFVEKQLRNLALSAEREKRREVEERHLKVSQATDAESASLESLKGWGSESGGEGYDSEGATLRRQVKTQEDSQKSVDVSETVLQDGFDADGFFQI